MLEIRGGEYNTAKVFTDVVEEQSAAQILSHPINMRDGNLICVRKKSNEDWNCSAPHGAGRLMSRSQARHSHAHAVESKWTAVSQEALDECPMAYKTMDDIVLRIGDTAEITDTIRSVYNLKAGMRKNNRRTAHIKQRSVDRLQGGEKSWRNLFRKKSFPRKRSDSWPKLSGKRGASSILSRASPRTPKPM